MSFRLMFLFFLVALTGGLAWNVLNVAAHPHILIESEDAFATQVTSIQFSPTGKKKYQLITPELRHYSAQNTVRVSYPKLYLYNQQQEAWVITADEAMVFPNKDQIQFMQNVELSGSQTKNNQNTRVMTEKLDYFPKKNTAVTSNPVTMLQPGFVMYAVGAAANFNDGAVHLFSNITGSYDPRSLA